ncbi:MAG: hypothetical protein RDU25_00565 [Patescibacteria group bacterium]|nr:hypothetical protein [Patescibacteria group bacterium]
MHAWFKQRRFALCLAVTLLCVEAALFFSIYASAPPDTRWLGDTIYFPGDAAVYLSYIHQIADGAQLQDNLYAIEPHSLRFNPFWTALGLVARLGFSPLSVYIGASLLLTLPLVLALYEVCLYTTHSATKAKLATTIAILGGTTGWMYTIYISLFKHWGWKTVVAPDLGSEFSIFPVLFGGPHNILSTLLILIALNLSWRGVQDDAKTKKLIIFSLPTAILLSYHPYFTPLIVIFISLACLWELTAWKERARKFVALLLLPGVVTASIYLPEIWDQTFMQQHLVTNQQPLAPLLSWVMTLALPSAALLWRWKKRITITQEEKWVVAWILSVLIFVVLPFPWKRKATQGLAIAFVLLGLPFWSFLTEKIRSINPRLIRTQMSVVFWIALALTPLHFITSQLAWIAQTSDTRIWFYRPDGVFSAWEYLHAETQPDKTIVMTDEAWLNLWTPAYAVRTVFVGHDHESPDYSRKMERWKNLLTSEDTEKVLGFLSENAVSDIMLTRKTSVGLEARLSDIGWSRVFEQDEVRILHRP